MQQPGSIVRTNSEHHTSNVFGVILIGIGIDIHGHQRRPQGGFALLGANHRVTVAASFTESILQIFAVHPQRLSFDRSCGAVVRITGATRSIRVAVGG